MSNTYVFGFTHESTEQVIKRRPWWNLFGRDQIVPVKMTTRTSLILDEGTAMRIKNGSDAFPLILAIFPTARNFQLEVGGTTTAQYVKVAAQEGKASG